MNSDLIDPSTVPLATPTPAPSGGAAPASGTDFLDSSPLDLHSTGEHEARYQFRVAKDLLVVSDGMDAGTILISLPVSPAIDPACTKLSQEYEYFSLSNFEISFEATSPFGTSSGGFQACWITDPANAYLPQETQAQKLQSLTKVIRQEGSVLIRPRNSANMVVKTQGRRYCLSGPDPRLSSYGNIVCVVRAPPSTGDLAAFSVTATGTMNFHRTAGTNGTTAANVRLPFPLFDPETAAIARGGFTIEGKLPVNKAPFDSAEATFCKPPTFELTTRNGRFINRTVIQPQTVALRLLDFDDEDSTFEFHFKSRLLPAATNITGLRVLSPGAELICKFHMPINTLDC